MSQSPNAELLTKHQQKVTKLVEKQAAQLEQLDTKVAKLQKILSGLACAEPDAK
jgi:hypothetical protein